MEAKEKKIFCQNLHFSIEKITKNYYNYITTRLKQRKAGPAAPKEENLKQDLVRRKA
jgi:hypothetical protein